MTDVTLPASMSSFRTIRSSLVSCDRNGSIRWLTNRFIRIADRPDLAANFLSGLPAGEYPYLVEHVHQHLKESSPDDEGEFAFGLDLILDGFERIRDSAAET
jgi:hypothetical protein